MANKQFNKILIGAIILLVICLIGVCVSAIVYVKEAIQLVEEGKIFELVIETLIGVGIVVIYFCIKKIVSKMLNKNNEEVE